MGKKSHKKKGREPCPLLSTPVNADKEFEGLASFEELSACTFMKLNNYGEIKREVWKGGKIVKKNKLKIAKWMKEKGKSNKSLENDVIDKDGNENISHTSLSKDKKKKNIDVKDDISKEIKPEPEMLEEKPRKKSKLSKKSGKAKATLNVEETGKRKQKSKEPSVACKKARYDTDTFHGNSKSGKAKVDVSEWEGIFAPPPVLDALSELGFSTPTEIQRLVLPAAIKGRMDIIGAAETGSGKTLAFGIPIIHGILCDRDREAEQRNMGDDSGVENSDNEELEDTDSEDNSQLTAEDFPDAEEIDCAAFQNYDGEISSDSEESHNEDGGDEESDNEENDNEESDNSENDNQESDNEENEMEVGSDGEVPDTEFGCVKVIENVDFDFLEKDETPLQTRKPLRALIVTPTRELAIQVRNHLVAVLVHTDIKVAVVVGGLSIDKQTRILNRRPEIVVGTPGRLWELLQQGNEHLNQLENISYLAIDETDRMVEQGHFDELKHLLERVNRDEATKDKRQNFVFSATLTLVHSAPKRSRMKGKAVRMTSEIKVKQLAKIIGLKAKPKVIDVTRKFGTAESLTESRINCDKDEKDYYLYYFLKQYPGRTLVFCNSIDCVRRLQNLFTLLQCQPQSLHASMHQKQRLKSLEKFSSSRRALLLATDVAARGLDIPNIQHVIHYQTPRTAETYIHRSGRTARATQEGLSVLFIDSTEMSKYRQLCKTLNRAADLPPFPVDISVLNQVKKRLNFARKLETMEHSHRKSRAEENWLKKAAREAELIFDEEEYDDDATRERDMRAAKQKRENKNMRAKLMQMLATPLFSSDFSGKYPTQTGALVTPLDKEGEQWHSTQADNEALSVMKKESVEFSKLVKTVKPREPRKKKTNKKKFKGFEKRKLKLQKEMKEMEASED